MNETKKEHEQQQKDIKSRGLSLSFVLHFLGNFFVMPFLDGFFLFVCLVFY